MLSGGFILQLLNVKIGGCDLGKGLQRKSAWKRRKEEMKVQVRLQRGDLGIYFQTCLFLAHTLGREGRHSYILLHGSHFILVNLLEGCMEDCRKVFSQRL
jgi:hypothetical protein